MRSFLGCAFLITGLLIIRNFGVHVGYNIPFGKLIGSTVLFVFGYTMSIGAYILNNTKKELNTYLWIGALILSFYGYIIFGFWLNERYQEELLKNTPTTIVSAIILSVRNCRDIKYSTRFYFKPAYLCVIYQFSENGNIRKGQFVSDDRKLRLKDGQKIKIKYVNARPDISGPVYKHIEGYGVKKESNHSPDFAQ